MACADKQMACAGKTKAPMIVNTPGWVKGLGLTLLQDLIVRLSPSHVITIDGPSAHKNLPSGAFWSESAATDSPAIQRIPLQSHTQSTPVLPHTALRAQQDTPPAQGASVLEHRRPSVEVRSARAHAWICEVLAAHDLKMAQGTQLARLFSGDLRASASELCGCRPVAVDLGDVAVVPLLATVPSVALAAVLNGSLVSLCTIPALSNGQQMTQDEIQVCELCVVHGNQKLSRLVLSLATVCGVKNSVSSAAVF
jgi:hypothetical protein